MAASSSPADAAPPDDLDAAIAGLYGGPLDEFVTARDGLARALRTAGRRDEAAAVLKLAKPKRLAWALDAAVLAHRDQFERVDAAAEALAAARSGAEVREATNALRNAARALADIASERAADAGTKTDQSELVPAVLAVTADPEALAELRAGRLVDLPSGGAFGLFAPGPGPARGEAPTSAPRPKPDVATAADTSASAKAPSRAEEPPAPAVRRASAREIKAAQRAVERAESEADAARSRAEEAADAAERAAAELAAAEDRRLQAQREVEGARERVDEARREARRAAAEAQDADDAVREARTARASLG